MLLCQITINGTLYRISDELLTLEHTWYPYIASFSSPQRQIATDYGGFVRLGFGSITMSPSLFEYQWPPPYQCSVTIQYTATNEAAAIDMFTTSAYLIEYSRESITYKLQDIEYDKDLLIEMEDYNENTVAIARAFGTVTHRTPTQLKNVDIGGVYGEAPTYHAHSLSLSTTAFKIIGFSSYSSGTATQVTVGDIDGNPTNTGYSNSETVIITNSDNFDGSFVISNVSGSTFTIAQAFATESTPIYAQVYQSKNFQVYDDGIPINENLYNNGDGTFSLKATPVGQVTISGTASQTTLDAIASWARTQLDITSYTNTYGRVPSPTVACWISSQQTIVDFLSGICAYCSHLFYIASDTLTLVDMYKDNGSSTLTEFQFFESPTYGKFSPIKKISSSWNTYSAETGNSGGEYDVTVSHYIKTNEHEISELLYEHGSETTISPYQVSEDSVRSSLVLIKGIVQKDSVSISIPISASLPVPGQKISWTDTSLIRDTPGYIRIRILTYDFINDTVTISGDGVFIRLVSNAVDVPVASEIITTETVDSFDDGIAKGCTWHYIVDDGSRTNMRIGEISAVWDQVDDSTPKIVGDSFGEEIGTTFPIVTFTVNKSGGTVRLICNVTSGLWYIYGTRTLIGVP